MARGNIYRCRTCGVFYEYCPQCAIVKPKFLIEEFCTKAHQDIFNILSKHGCNLATAEETLEALKDYDISNLNENLQAHISSLSSKKAESIKEVEHDEPTQE